MVSWELFVIEEIAKGNSYFKVLRNEISRKVEARDTGNILLLKKGRI